MAKTRIILSLVLIVVFAAIFRLYWHEGLPYSHDGENHVARFADYAAAVRQGQIPPRLAPNLWSAVSYPVFIFNYPLSNLLSLPFSALSIKYVITFKLLTIAYVALGAIGLWIWLRSLPLTLTETARTIALTTWLSFPFLLSTIYFRGNIGEIAAYGLLPWLLYGVELAKTQYRWSPLLIGGVTMAFLLAHNISAVLVWPLIGVYACFTLRDDWSGWKRWLIPTLLGGLTTTWFWLPAIVERRYTILDSAVNNSTAPLQAPYVFELVHSPLRFGFSYPGSVDTLSFTLGITWLVVVAAMLFLLVTKPSAILKHWVYFLLTSAVVLIALQLKPFASVWSLPIVSFIQFPWRLSLFLSISVATLSAILWQYAPTFIRYCLIVGLGFALFTIAHLSPIDHVYKTNEDYASFPHSTTTQNENLPTTFTGLHVDVPVYASLSEGEGTVQIELWKGTEHIYQVRADSSVTVVESTLYFPGWVGTAIDQNTGETHNLTLDPTLNRGWLSYTLPPGEYAVTTHFGETTWPRRTGDILSVVGVIALLMTPMLPERTTKGYTATKLRSQ